MLRLGPAQSHALPAPVSLRCCRFGVTGKPPPCRLPARRHIVAAPGAGQVPTTFPGPLATRARPPASIRAGAGDRPEPRKSPGIRRAAAVFPAPRLPASRDLFSGARRGLVTTRGLPAGSGRAPLVPRVKCVAPPRCTGPVPRPGQRPARAPAKGSCAFATRHNLVSRVRRLSFRSGLWRRRKARAGFRTTGRSAVDTLHLPPKWQSRRVSALGQLSCGFNGRECPARVIVRDRLPGAGSGVV